MAYRSGSTGLRRTFRGGHESPGTLIGWAWLAPVASLRDGSHPLAALMPLPFLGKFGAQWVSPSSTLSFSSGRVLGQDRGDLSACSCRCSALHRERHFPCVLLLGRCLLSQPPSVLSSCPSWCCHGCGFVERFRRLRVEELQQRDWLACVFSLARVLVTRAVLMLGMVC